MLTPAVIASSMLVKRHTYIVLRFLKPIQTYKVKVDLPSVVIAKQFILKFYFEALVWIPQFYFQPLD